MKELEIANWLNEGSKSKANTNQVGGRTRTYTGVALADSNHGRVVVDMGGDSVTAEGEQGVEIPCGPQVKKGDRVLITTVNGSPYVSSVDGWGDYIGDQAAYASLYVGELDARHITAQRIDAATAYIGELEAEEITAEKITATAGFFDDLAADNITAQTIIADSATVGDLAADHVSTTDLTAVNASISSLQSDKADISYLTSNYIDADTIAADYATVDLANVNNAWIDHGVIRDAAISSAQIIGVSANKLTAGTINGSVINVTNLNADNITAGTLNGQRLGQGTIDLDKLSADVYTEDEVDTIVGGLNDRIDAQIETWTTDAVPTLNNYPASSWNTNDLKAEHVGDICYVINDASEANGYTYRFAYDNTNQAYSWILIKDNQVTAALRRLVTAEGKIEGLESFKTSTSTWITQTDSGIETIRNRTTTLETDFGTFQTETFADLVDEVDEQSSTITTLSETTSTISNTVNSVSQTASSNSSKISGLITTVGANSDGTNPGSSSIISRTSAVEQDLSGFKTTVSSTYATKESVKGVNLGEFYSHDLTDIYDATDNPNAWWRQEATRATALENGWAHIVMDNTENSSTMYAEIYPNIGSIPVVEGMLLIEIKNMVTNAGSSQLWYNASGTTSGTQVPAMTNKNGTTALVNGVRYHAMIPTENNNPTMWARSWFGISGGKSAEFDVRLSYYEGEYDGPYKPYVDQTLSSRVKFAESAIIQNANNISIKVSQTDFEEGVSDAATKATGYITDFGANGVKIHPLNSTTDYAFIDATGLEVYDGGTSVAKFGENARIGEADKQRFAITSNTASIYDSNNALAVKTNTDGVTLYRGGSQRAALTANGLDIYGSNGTDTIASFGSTSRVGTASGQRVVTTSSGVDIYNSSNQKKASYGTTQYIYGGSGTYPYVMTSSSGSYLYQSANNHADVTSSGLDVYQGGVKVSSFGSTVTIGQADKHRVYLGADAINIYDKNNKLAQQISASGDTMYAAGTKRSVFNASGMTLYAENGTTVSAEFKDTEVNLGKNSTASVINMCGGKAKISYSSTQGAQFYSADNATYIGSSDWGNASSNSSWAVFAPKSFAMAHYDTNGYGVQLLHALLAATNGTGFSLFTKTANKNITMTGILGLLGALSKGDDYHFIPIAGDKYLFFKQVDMTFDITTSFGSLYYTTLTGQGSTIFTTANGKGPIYSIHVSVSAATGIIWASPVLASDRRSYNVRIISATSVTSRACTLQIMGICGISTE